MKIENKLTKEQKFTQNLTETAGVIILSLDPNHGIVWCSENVGKKFF